MDECRYDYSFVHLITIVSLGVKSILLLIVDSDLPKITFGLNPTGATNVTGFVSVLLLQSTVMYSFPLSNIRSIIPGDGSAK